MTERDRFDSIDLQLQLIRNELIRAQRDNRSDHAQLWREIGRQRAKLYWVLGALGIGAAGVGLVGFIF
jgi:hypothetical protein